LAEIRNQDNLDPERADEIAKLLEESDDPSVANKQNSLRVATHASLG
jgi:hypothetical protein